MNNDLKVVKTIKNLQLSIKLMVTDDENKCLMQEKGTDNVYVVNVNTKKILQKNKSQKNKLDVCVMTEANGCYFVGGTDYVTIIDKKLFRVIGRIKMP